MRNFLLLLLLFLFQTQKSRAQKFPEPSEKVAVSGNLKEGFYLLKSGNSKDFPKAGIVKRLGEGNFIIHISETTKSQLPSDADLYKVSPEWKLSPSLRDEQPSTPLLLSLKTLDGKKFLETSDYEILQQNGDYLVVRASPQDLQQLLPNQEVIHISEYTFPRTETFVSYHDLSVNNINYLQHLYPSLRGKEMRVSVKENLFDSEDIDLRNRTFPTVVQGEKVDQHATIIATLIAGAGNSGSKGKGGAPEAEVGSSSFLRLLPDPLEIFQENRISVQNHSYGTTLEYEYGNEAAAYDASAMQLPWLVHVFSSGNLGTETPTAGRFKGVAGFANLTGNFKFAKNIITVGALDANGQISARSSKGPAPDGRLKPELVAYAPAGTSDAAALVSGTVLLLQEEYLNQHQQLPSSALIKSVLMAGAEDVGPANIDYSSGYGNLDAAASMEILKSGTYFEGEASQADPFEFKFDIPEGTNGLKLALSWLDPAANPGDDRALIQDLDLELVSPDGNIWKPWVLDPENLLKEAQRGEDDLNPAELITLDTPSAGTYTILVSAADISEKQAFAIAYITESESSFSWTYPTSNDPLWEDQENVLRWENTFSEESAKLEISFGESEWELLDQALDPNAESYPLQLQKNPGTAQLRMTIGAREFLSDVFVIAPEILPEPAYNCEEEFMLSWNKIKGASAYQVQYLGEKYMEPAMMVQDTTALIDKSEYESGIWSVSPIFGDLRGHEGRAIDYRVQGVGCHYRTFFALLEQGPVVNTSLNLSSGHQVLEVQLLRENSSGTKVLKTFSRPLGQLQLEIRDEAPEVGDNLYYALIKLENGKVIRTQTVEIYVPGENTLEVYPNPVKAGELLSVRSLGDQLDVEIFDTQGRKLSEDWLVRYNDHVEIRFFARGLYFLRASRAGEEVGVAKILVH